MRLAALFLVSFLAVANADEAEPVFNTFDGLRVPDSEPSIDCLKCLSAKLKAQQAAAQAQAKPQANAEKGAEAPSAMTQPRDVTAANTSAAGGNAGIAAGRPPPFVEVKLGDESHPTPRDL